MVLIHDEWYIRNLEIDFSGFTNIEAILSEFISGAVALTGSNYTHTHTYKYSNCLATYTFFLSAFYRFVFSYFFLSSLSLTPGQRYPGTQEMLNTEDIRRASQRGPLLSIQHTRCGPTGKHAQAILSVSQFDIYD